MKYRCSHCNHIFELGEREFHRCPNCFWTTSLVPVGGERHETVVSETIPTPPKQRLLIRKPLPTKRITITVILTALIGVLFFLLFKSGLLGQKFSENLSARVTDQEASAPGLKKDSSKRKSAKTAQLFLTKEGQADLAKPFRMTIPRQLSGDEEEILKKQVSLPAALAKKPTLKVWKKEEFEKMVESEQSKRKIRLGWSYVRSLTKTFEEYYPPAIAAFEKGNYVLARELFLKSLSFQVYRNDPKFHRAVALVILRSYINDVIGKIALLNQYLLSQSLVTEVRALFESYQALFPVLELQEWEHALQLVGELKKRIETLENQPQSAQVNYPVAFVELDPEIQAAIQAEAAPKPEAAVNFKALSIDLNLKEKVVRQNTSEELLKVQRQYEEISRQLAQGDWDAAREGLEAVEFPPELASEAKKKLALMDQALALQEEKEKN